MPLIQIPPFSQAVELIPPQEHLTNPSHHLAVPNEPFISSDPAAVKKYLCDEVECKVLDELAPSFFVFAKRRATHLDTLHEYDSTGRTVTISENVGLHLVRNYHVVYCKPIPHCLLNWEFWARYLVPDAKQQMDGGHGIGTADATTGSTPRSITPTTNNTTTNNAIRPNTPLSSSPKKEFPSPASHYPSSALSIEARSALGLLRTYALLITHESDFRLALRIGLLPTTTTYPSFQHFIEPFRHIPDAAVSPRYQYGHIRLTRLNLAVRILRPRALGKLFPWSYNHMYWHSGQYLGRFAAPMLFLFACLTLILSSMQVGLAALPGGSVEAEESVREHWDDFMTVSRWFSIAIVLGIIGLALLVGLGVGLYVLNRIFVGWFVHERWKPGRRGGGGKGEEDEAS